MLETQVKHLISTDEKGKEFLDTIESCMRNLDPANLKPEFYRDEVGKFEANWRKVYKTLRHNIAGVNTQDPRSRQVAQAMQTMLNELKKARSTAKHLAHHCDTWLTLSGSLQEGGASQRKTAWNKDFKRLLNAASSLIEAKLITDLERDKALLACSVARGIHFAFTGTKTYGWQSEVKVKVMQALTGDFMVNYEDSQRGQQSSIAGMLEVALDLPGLTNDIAGLDFNQAVPKEIKGSEEVFKVLATVLAARKMLPIANNGSNSLFSWDDDNQVLPLLDSMFDDISQAAAYGLGFLNGSLENILGMGEELHDNILQEVDGRKVVGMVYNSTMLTHLGFLKKPDGSTLSNFTCPSQIGQTRYMLRNPRNKAFAAFGKGENGNARFSFLGDGRIVSTKTIINFRTDNVERSLVGYSEAEVATIEELTENPRSTMEDLPESIRAKAETVGDFMGSPTTELSKAKDSEERIARWDSWFEANTWLPWVFGIEKGQIKGRAKRMFDKLVPSAAANIGQALKDAGGYIILPDNVEAHGVIIIKSPSQSISSTSTNFQPQAILLSPEEAGLVPEGHTWSSYYKERTDEEMMSYTRQAITLPDDAPGIKKEQVKAKLEFFDKLLKKVGASEATISNYPKALMGNVGAGMWRWFTNFHKTDMPTRRVFMHEFSYRGFLLVDDHYANEPVEVASWRGPLIAFSAIQAPVALSRKVAARLRDALSYQQNLPPVDAKQIDLIKARLLFKNPELKLDGEQEVIKLLNEMVELGTFMRLDDSIMVIDERDLVDMQGDDDGDTVTIDNDPWIVQQFAYTEQWWANFLKVNNFCNPRLEMPKEAKVDFSVGKRLVLEKIRAQESMPITDEESNAILHSGTPIPELAEQLGLPHGKVPRLTGFTFAELLELNEWTNGRLLGDPKWFAPVCKVLGSNPAGPIGAPSNCAPDILIKALAHTEEDGITLTPLGRFLYQFYQNSASQTQVSIDFGKRIVDIMAGFCADHPDFPKFNEEITPDMMGSFLAKKLPETYTQVVINTDDQHKVIRVIEVNELTSELFSPVDLCNLSQGKAPIELFQSLEGLQYYSCHDLDGFVDFMRSRRLKVKATEVAIKDPSNGCYDFASIYAYAEFALGQIPSKQLLKPAVWKPGKGGLMELLTEKRDEVLHSFGESSSKSALVANATSFFNYFDNSDVMRDIMSCTTEFVNTVRKNVKLSEELTDLWPAVKASVAQYFNEEYKIGQKKASKRSILKAIYRGFGLSPHDVDQLELGEQVMVGELELDIFDILSMLIVCDESYLDNDIPQTTWQVLIEAFVEAEDPTVLDERIIPFVDACYEEDVAFLNAIPNETTGKVGTIISTPTSILNFLGEEFVNRLLEQDFIVRKQGGDSSYYSYTNAQAVLGVAAETLTLCKNELLGDELINVLSENYDALLGMFDENPFQAVRDVVFGLKAAFKPYNDSIRYLEAMLKIDHLPVDPYSVGGNGVPKLKMPRGSLNASTSALRGLSPRQVADGRNLFGSTLSPKNIILSLSQDKMLPAPQVNREASWDAVFDLAASGCLVKSYSYFGNAGWKDTTTIQLMSAVQAGNLGIYFNHNSGMIFDRQEAQRTLFSDLVRSMSFLNLLGTSDSEYHSFRNISKYCRYPGVDQYVDITPAGRFRLLGSSLKFVESFDHLMESVCSNKPDQEFDDLLHSLAVSWDIFQDLLSPNTPWCWICRKHQSSDSSNLNLPLYDRVYTERDRDTLTKRLSQIVEVCR